MGLLMILAQNGAWVGIWSLFLAGIWLVSFCIQRVYFHPLSKYPGPFLAKVTDLYAAYHAWKGDIHIDMWRCHELYGPYVRYAPERLNINSAAALKDIYGNNKNFTKSPNYRVLRHGPANTLTMIDKKEHARRRRIMAQGVSDASMRSHEYTILAHIRKCFDKVSSTDDDGLGLVETIQDTEGGWTTARNMSNWFNWLTFDIMGDLIFGMQYNLLGEESNRVIPEAIEESNVRVSVLLQSPIIRQIGRVDRWLFPKAIEARDVFLQFVGGLVDKCMSPENKSSARTVVSILRSAIDPETGGKLSAKELLAESTTLCVAGADTTSTALAATFFYLSYDSRVYEKVVEEVRSTFASTEEIRLGAKLGSLPYLRACIDEAMRMSPPVGSSLSRKVLPGGASVNGEFFPEGVELGVPIYGIHHNPEYYPDPFTYRPERWIVSDQCSSKASVELSQSALCPFSIGPRSCVGKGMAIIELMLTLSFALFTSDFRLADGYSESFQSLVDKRIYHPNEFTTKDHITATKSGPYLQFRQRNTLRTMDTFTVPPVKGRQRQGSLSQLPQIILTDSNGEQEKEEQNRIQKTPQLKIVTRKEAVKTEVVEEAFSPTKPKESFSPFERFNPFKRQDSFDQAKPFSPLRRQNSFSDMESFSPVRRQELFDQAKPLSPLRSQDFRSPLEPFSPIKRRDFSPREMWRHENSPAVSINGTDLFISLSMNK